MVNLTNPALLLYREEIPMEKTSRCHYLEIISHLQKYKEAFTDNDVWTALSVHLGKTLEIEWQERGEEESLVIERILILVRNILQVPADTDTEKRPDNDASIHDQVLWSLHQSGMVDILLYIATSENEHSYYMHVLEITSLMLREQTASSLASAALNRSQTEKERDDAELSAIRLKENEERRHKLKIFNGARHSRFGGTYVVKNLKSISNNDLIFHKPLNKLDSLNFDMNKSKVKTPKNRLPVRDNQVERRSAFSIRMFLKEFCVEFLNGAYNTIMYNVKDAIVRAKAQAHDESYYLWAMRFFMEFNRCYKFEVKLVSETMSTQTFHFVQQQIETYYDLISTDKKKLLLWSRRLHLGLGAYRELLLTVIAMSKSEDKEVRNSAAVIQSNIFYVLEYREILLTMMLSYDELKMSRSYLNDLIETQHIFVKMLEAFCGGKDSSFVVQRKLKAQRKKEKRVNKSNIPATTAPPNRDEQWEEVSPQLSVVLENDPVIPSNIIPFDAASDISIDDQKTQAMCKIQTLLRQHEYENAIGLLRASREVWPENDCFGSAEMTAVDELLALKEIFYAEIQEDSPKEVIAPEDDESEEDSENEEDEYPKIAEADFKFTDFINRFAHPKITRACGLAVQHFETNTDHTNHCIVKLLHRIAWDCKMPAMLFQASLFRTFQRILRASHLTRLKELVKFSIFVIGKFVQVAQKNNKIYMEILFWKNSREAYDLEEGYGSYNDRGGSHKGTWTELEEDELRRLFAEHQEQNIEKDVVDWICENLIDHTRTRRAVLKKLKDLYLLTNYKNKPSKSSRRPPKEWSEEEEAKLQELMSEYRQSDDPIGNIMESLIVHRPKARVIEKLLSMGLIQDRAEVRKKRARKSQGDNFRGNSDTSELSSDDSDEDSQEPRVSKPKSRPQPKKASIGAEAIKAILDIIEKGLSAPLKWLHESISDAADDLEDEANDDGVPLVPITTDEMDAMENPSFLHLLRSLGIAAPFDEQESYWRIPGHFSVEDLRKLCQVITEGLEGTLQVPSENDPPPQSPNVAPTYAEESSDDDVFAQVKKFVHKSDDEPLPSPTPNKKKNKTKEKLLSMETEDLLNLNEPNTSEDDINSVSSESSKKSTKNKPRKKSRAKRISGFVRSDSESDSKSIRSEISNSSSKTSSKKARKLIQNSDIDSTLTTQQSKPSTSQSNISSLYPFLSQVDDSDSDSDLLTLGSSKKTPPENQGKTPGSSNKKSRIVRQVSDSENEDSTNDIVLDTEEPPANNGHTSLLLESDSDDEVTSKRGRLNTSDTDNDNGKVKRPKMIISDDED